ncbi:hypothetical protein HOY80DRAFT_958892 [Tuber brumale]|nr:hypothetical protein HOY80DRAFT_958892 [Tuber brumale]
MQLLVLCFVPFVLLSLFSHSHLFLLWNPPLLKCIYVPPTRHCLLFSLPRYEYLCILFLLRGRVIFSFFFPLSFSFHKTIILRQNWEVLVIYLFFYFLPPLYFILPQAPNCFLMGRVSIVH